MNFSTLLITLVFSVSARTAAALTKDDCVQNGYTYVPEVNGCYKAFVMQKSWNEARDICLKDGADLVVINNSDEEKYVLEVMRSSQSFFTKNLVSIWLGVHAEDNQWITVHGKNVETIEVLKPHGNTTPEKNMCLNLMSTRNSREVTVLYCNQRYGTFACEKVDGTSQENPQDTNTTSNSSLYEVKQSQDTIIQELAQLKNLLLDNFNDLKRNYEEKIRDFKYEMTGLNDSLKQVRDLQQTVLNKVKNRTSEKYIGEVKNETLAAIVNTLNQIHQTDISDFKYDISGLKNSVSEIKQTQETILEEIEKIRNRRNECSFNDLNQTSQKEFREFKDEIIGLKNSLKSVNNTQEIILNEISDVKNKNFEGILNKLNKTQLKDINDFKDDVIRLNDSFRGMKQVQEIILEEIKDVKNRTYHSYLNYSNQTCQANVYNHDIIGLNNSLSEIKRTQYFILQEFEKLKNGTFEGPSNNLNEQYSDIKNEIIKAMNCKKINYTFELGIGCHKIYTTDDWTVYKNWWEAQEICRRDGASLAVVDSTAEAEHLGNMIGRMLTFGWIGIHEENGEWVTVDGKSVGSAGYDQWYYQNGDNAPKKNECLTLRSDSQRNGLNNIDCRNKLRAFICEK